MINIDPEIIFKPVRAAERGTKNETRLLLHRHEKIVGTVLKSDAPGQALVFLKGQKVYVRTHVPLTEGSQVMLQVKSTAPAPILQFLGEAPPGGRALTLSEMLSAIKGNIWKMTMDATLRSNAGPEEKNSILALLEKVTTRLDNMPSPGKLSAFVHMSGLSLEAKIKKALLNGDAEADMRKLIEHDLKGLLSKLVGRGMAGRGHLKKLLDVIEKIQLLNQEGLEQGGKIYLPLPMQLPGGFFSVVELLLHMLPADEEETDDRANRGHGFKATILLEMSRLGPIRAEFVVRGERVEGMFMVANAKAKNVLEKNLFAFTDNLNDRGFSIKHVGCFLKDPEMVSRPLLKEIVPEEESALCLVG